MFGSKEQVFTVTLHRRDRNTPWGISVVGGVDQGTPILITKVMRGSPGDNKLINGDEIRKIGDYDARDITHQNVYNLFQKAGTAINLVIRRKTSTKLPSLLNDATSPLEKSKSQSSLSSSSFRLRNSGAPKTVVFPPPSPYDSVPEPVFYDTYNFAVRNDDSDVENVKNQPYRTTPLVLPGAKAKHEKEMAPTGTYLRHHPNPMVRAAPMSYELLPQEVAMKQKVADSILEKIERDEALAGKQIIRKQFNTPIGLYSDKNIVDTIQNTTGNYRGLSRSSSFGRQNQGLAPRKTVVYNPAKSETFKALQEEQYGDVPVREVNVPVQPKIYTPTRTPSQKANQPVHAQTYNPTSHSSHPNVQHHVPYVNSMGHSEDKIAQSGSFKRLMNMVLPDSSY